MDKAMMRFWALVAGVVMLTGCGTGIGPRSIGNERILYNEVLRKTQDEQLLLNLVRLRYNDTTQFLDLGSVVAQYGVETRGSAGLRGGINGLFAGAAPDGGSASAGVEVVYQERPTVTYAPLQGENFANRMLSPIPLEVIVLMANSGWSIERLSLICVERVNRLENAPAASGPTPESEPSFVEFQEYAKCLRMLVKRQLVRLHADPVMGETGKPDDRGRMIHLIFLPPANAEDAALLKQFKTLLGLALDAEKVKVSKSFYPMEGNTLAIRTRSLMGVLYFCSKSVEVPREHMEQKLVRMTYTAGGQAFDWDQVYKGLFRIRSAKEMPVGEMLKVQYRGYWFYVDDTDADSKATFGLLQLLFSLQSTSGQERMPLLTIPTN
jgi:hypothetical protein